MRRPQPPVGFKSQNLQTLEDLRNLRDSQRAILAWIDDQIASHAGVTSFAGRTGTVIPVTADYASSYLLRSANDFNTFTAKHVPVNGDILLTEDSANSGAKAYSTVAEVVRRDPYLVKSTSSNSVAAFSDWFDDFNNGGSADLATRGWTFWNQTDNTTMTRNGDISPWGRGGVLAADRYNSRLLSTGGLLLQMPIVANKGYSLYKAVTFPSGTNGGDGAILTARLGHSVAITTTEHAFTNVFAALASAGRPDQSNRVFVEQKYLGSNTARYRRGVILAGVDTGADVSFNQAGPIHDIVGLRCDSTNTWRHFWASSSSHDTWSSASVTGITKANVAYAGLGFFVSNVAGSESENIQLRHLGHIALASGTGVMFNEWIAS